MVVMGLDISLHSTGVFITNEKYETIYCTALKDKTKLEQQKIIGELINKYKVTNVCIEDIFYSKNVDTLKKLAFVHGSITVMLDELKIPYKYYSVATIKSVALKVQGVNQNDTNGKRKKGDKLKQEVQKAMFIIFGKFCNDKELDISDAGSIAYAFLKKLINI